MPLRCHAEFISASDFHILKHARLLSYSVYIKSNIHRSVFYIGVTSNLMQRVWQYKNNEGGIFTSKYKCHYLLYYEDYQNIHKAIEREKNLKNWHRAWKMNLIKRENQEMNDLAADWYS